MNDENNLNIVALELRCWRRVMSMMRVSWVQYNELVLDISNISV